MGLAWCRERVEQAQNSKSPVDRILVCCSNVIKPKTAYSHSQGKVANDFIYKGMRSKNLEISNPVPIHAVPPRARQRTQRSSDWQTCTLTVPDPKNFSEPPIPPPRKKRKKKINSMEVLNNELPQLHSPSYVIYSENLLSKKAASLDSVERIETDEFHPMEKSFSKEKTDLFGKLSGNRARKIKIECHPTNAKEGRAKYDNEKKAEEKIKHVSTVSLPNYNELVKPGRKVSTDAQNGDDKTGNQSVGLKHPHRNSSTISLPGEGSNSILSSLSEATIHRLETYMKKCRSFGPLKPQQLLEKLEEFNKTHRSASESEDSWSGLDDWDLGVIEYCDSEMRSPLTPKSTLPPKQERNNNQQNDPKQEENVNKNENETDIEENPPTGRTPFIQRSESVIEGVPIEWFFDPSLRLPMIMPSPEPESSKTPPPSPENGAFVDTQTESSDDHSPLLNILRQYKDEESGEPELDIDENEIENVLVKDTLSFEEIDVKIPLSETLSPILPIRDRANSMTEDQARLMQGRIKRSPSIGHESSAHLLEKLQMNKDAIEKEIFLKPNELLQGLRRESLCESLPEDAFEAYVNKKKPSLRESLNNFLGFQDEKKPSLPNDDDDDDEKLGKASDEKIKNLNGDKDEREEEKEPPLPPPPPPPPPILNPPPIVINPPQGEENTPVPYSLVKSNDNLNIV